MNKKINKMDAQELAVWLHLNRKAHAIKSKKIYNRKTEKKLDKHIKM